MDPLDVDPVNTTYMFSIEKTYDEEAFNSYMQEHWADSLVYSAVYLIVVFGGQFYMSRRKKFELRTCLAIWSSVLAIFSIIGAIRTVPEFVYALMNKGFEYSYCIPSYMGKGKVTSFWTGLFVMSKVLELGDTVFIVLRKQPLIFLHWYHHITVLIYVWYSYPDMIGAGRWFMVMNYVVHSFMYSYYALRAMRYQFPKCVNMFITTLQLLQMIGGLYANIGAYYALNAGRECVHSYKNIQYCISMYFSYLVLFSHFFYTTYIVQKPRGHHHEKQQ